MTGMTCPARLKGDLPAQAHLVGGICGLSRDVSSPLSNIAMQRDSDPRGRKPMRPQRSFHDDICFRFILYPGASCQAINKSSLTSKVGKERPPVGQLPRADDKNVPVLRLGIALRDNVGTCLARPWQRMQRFHRGAPAQRRGLGCKDGAGIFNPRDVGSRPSGRTSETPASLHRTRNSFRRLKIHFTWQISCGQPPVLGPVQSTQCSTLQTHGRNRKLSASKHSSRSCRRRPLDEAHRGLGNAVCSALRPRTW